MNRCGASLLVVLLASFAFTQDVPGRWTWFHPNQQVLVRPLEPLTAKTHDWPDVLLASLAIVFDDNGVCCGKNSALDDRAISASRYDLQDVASTIHGRFLLSDGRPILIAADFTPASTQNAAYKILGTLKNNRSLLLVWDSHLYVLYGAIYDEVVDGSGISSAQIHKLLLIDPRFSHSRREVAFNSDTDDWSKVQGMLAFGVTPQ